MNCRAFNDCYAGWFNHSHRRPGHRFQGRFHAFLIEKEACFTRGASLRRAPTRCRRKSKPRSTDHPKTQRAVGRPKMHAS
jgi:hypothetical protein